MSPSIPWLDSLPLLAACVPVGFWAAALLTSGAAPFRWAGRVAALNGCVALTIASFVYASGASRGAHATSPGATDVHHFVALDVVSASMLLLVSAIAIVIVRYSRTSLRGDPCQVRYARALLATLGAVSLLVIANDLLVIALAWIGTSLALHHLLTTYDERPQALIVAHKKFLVSRLADVCVLVAIGILWRETGSTRVDALIEWARAHSDLSSPSRAAALLLVCGVALKSAQLPFHGWLIQVMEAPTPVSALLHAGIVNVGGFLMIRLAPFMTHADGARSTLVVIGTTTAVLAALIMTTRVSVKVALAWSTCAQMGMMLLQCGLGLWHLALLHLIAHSLYKAHAFLGSGTVVDGWRVQSIDTRRRRLTTSRALGGVAMVLAGIAAVSGLVLALTELLGRAVPNLWPVAIFLALSLSPLALGAGLGGRRALIAIGFTSAAVSALYLFWHAAFAGLVAAPESTAPSPVAIGIAVAGFALLFVVQFVLQVSPTGKLARSLQPKLFAGLYLDELFTRSTFRLWPPGLPPTRSRVDRLHVSEPQEACS